MTGPVSIDENGIVFVDGRDWGLVSDELACDVAAQLAAAGRVPELEAQIERLASEVIRNENSVLHWGREAERLSRTVADLEAMVAARDDIAAELRARLAAVPDLTELREYYDAYEDAPYGQDVCADLAEAVRRLLAASVVGGQDESAPAPVPRWTAEVDSRPLGGVVRWFVRLYDGGRLTDTLAYTNEKQARSLAAQINGEGTR